MTEALERVRDAKLITAVRMGESSAFGVLYERHLPAAKRAAACLSKTPAEREDLVAEAFTRVLRALREGRGPDEEFRPYLLVTLRNAAINGATRGLPTSPYAEVPDVCPVGSVDEPVIQKWQATVAADAFASLPERWQMVLWHTEVEEESPASVAPLLGMRPNSVAALAYRAREGLRRAYLGMQIPEPARRECRPTASKLAGYVRHSIPSPLSRKINQHLRTCPDCRARAAALTRVNAELHAMIGPVVLGAPTDAFHLPAALLVLGAVTVAVRVATPRRCGARHPIRSAARSVRHRYTTCSARGRWRVSSTRSALRSTSE
ncbi:MAG: sigma-70 family RNA polymerase sigma factor [Gemmatimonadales bacterium]